VFRAPRPGEDVELQALWEASSYADDPIAWSRGGWSLAAWATDLRVLEVGGEVVGLAAVRAEAAPDGALPARLALHPAHRTTHLAEQLVASVLDQVRGASGHLARLFVPNNAEWMIGAAQAAGFAPVRHIAFMLLPATVPSPVPSAPPDLRVRIIRPGEDQAVLAALNRAWLGTWNFVSISLDMLRTDLEGQRAGMLLAVDATERIVATCHAVLDLDAQHPDGAPRAWISNLTVDPDYRGRGLSRTMLALGIAHLRHRGATSITLGVDADDPAPYHLYRAVGFEVLTQTAAWDAALR
jgi:mycothiol synthase